MSNKSAAPAANKGGSKMIIIIGVVVVLIAGGGGGFWWMSRSAHAEGDEQSDGEHAGKSGKSEKPGKKGKQKIEAEGDGVVALDAFLVNLADKGGTHFLRATLKLVVEDEKTAVKMSKNEVVIGRVRSAILELLTQQTSDELITPEGKSALRKAIIEKVTPLTGGIEIYDVLLADFVVQF